MLWDEKLFDFALLFRKLKKETHKNGFSNFQQDQVICTDLVLTVYAKC